MALALQSHSGAYSLHVSLQPSPAASYGSCSSLHSRLVSDFRAKQAATRVLQCCCSARGRPSAVSGSSSMPSIPPSPRGMAGCIFHRATDGFGLAGPLELTQLLPLPLTRPLHQPRLPPSPIQPGHEHTQGWDTPSSSGQPGPGPCCPQWEESLPCTSSKAALFGFNFYPLSYRFSPQ